MSRMDSIAHAKILVVDDEPINLSILSDFLHQHVQQILVANNGDKAIEIAKEQKPDLILLDIRMPSMSGIEVCKHLKNEPDVASIPIIFLTASDNDIEEAFNVGGVDYILKPFRTNELLARVGAHIGISRLQTSLEDANKELASLNTTLEDRVRERTRELVTANANLRREVKERRHLQDKVEYLSRYDFVTRMYNRVSMEEHLATRLVEFQNESDAKLFFLFLDLDQFKVVNDTCGHLAGDELLRQLGELIKGLLSSADVIARMGGDEFAISYSSVSTDKAIEKANSVKQAIEHFHFEWEGDVFRIGASIGLLEIDESFDGVEHLISIAERTCHESKRKGGGEISVYNVTRELIDSGKKQMRWVPIIQQALDDDHFFLCGQRINHINGEEEEKLEVLIRLETQDQKILPPGHFIPVAEKYHLISALDTWVLEKVLQQTALFEKGFQLSINVSGESIIRDSFLDMAESAIKVSGINPSQICFEITETSALSNLNASREFIRRLRSVGCQFALDDFGTGTSSYSYLKELPVDFIKIDGIFVRDIESDKINRLMVESIVAIAREIGIKVVAECVETEEALNILKELSVDYAQGYFFHKPTKLSEL